MSTTEKDQRRRAPRRKAIGTSVVRIELKDGMGNARIITADLVDWSETGLSVTLVAPIKQGAMIQVRGKLGDERVEISRRATILWCKEDPNGGYRLGLEFVDATAGSNGNGGQNSTHSHQSDFKSHNVASDFHDLD